MDTAWQTVILYAIRWGCPCIGRKGRTFAAGPDPASGPARRFPYDPSLGSRLFRLEKQGDPAQRQREALEYVQEALSPMHQIDLQHVALTETGVQVGVSTDFGESAVEIPLWEPEEGGDADGDAIV